MKLVLLLACIALVSWGLTWLLRRYALARSIIDIPNARSSHSVPTPRGGGVAIVVSFLLSAPLLAWSGELAWTHAWALVGAGGAVAVIGFLDDHGHIAARWRLLGHFCAALWALTLLGGLPPLVIFGTQYDLAWVGDLLALFYLVWMLNLYNFMDGIDGIASVEAICACVGISLLYWLAGIDSDIAVSLALSAAVAGFLFWNFPPARIFMGDAGSGFLGMTLAVVSIQAAWAGSSFFYAWLILLGVFVVDATQTLLRRLLRGDKVYEAHRSHAYQFASRLHGGHKPVTLSVVAINLLWLLPMAGAVVLLGLDGLLGIGIAYAPLIALATRYNAGALEQRT